MNTRTRAWVVSLANAFGMIGVVSFPAIAPELQIEWELSNTEVGWLGGVYFAGYVAGVPILTGLTDRMEARHIVLFGYLVSTIASAGFGLLAEDLWSATIWRFLAGLGFAGSYMPAMKALSDAASPRHRHAAVSIYSASFSIGVSISYLGTGWLSAWTGWQTAFVILAILPLLSCLAVRLSLPLSGRATSRGMPDFRGALRNRRAIAFFIAYSMHNGESSTARAWIIPFLTVAAAGWAGGVAAWGEVLTAYVSLLNLISLFSILLLAALAPRFGLRRLILWTIIVSGLSGVLLAVSMEEGAMIVLLCGAIYMLTVPADAALLNSGLISRTEPSVLGATMALHATFAFAAAFIFPVIFGAVLDLAGGSDRQDAWIWAFAAVSVVTIGGGCAMRVLDGGKDLPVGGQQDDG